MARAPREDTGQIVTRLFTGQRRGGQLLLQRLRARWPAIVGDELAGRTRPAKVHRGTLWINVSDSSWSYELQFHKRELLTGIQAWLEDQSVTELRFRVGDITPLPGEREPSIPPERTVAAPAQPFAIPARDEVASDEKTPGMATPQAAPPEAGPPGSKPSTDAGTAPTAPRPSGRRTAPVAPVDAVTQAAQPIGDASLRAAFVRSLSKQQRRRQPQGKQDRGTD